jgi:hypothetical protein
VRLVDHDAIDRQPAEAVEEARGTKPFGGEIQKAQFAVCRGRQRLRARRGADLAVQA